MRHDCLKRKRKKKQKKIEIGFGCIVWKAQACRVSSVKVVVALSCDLIYLISSPQFLTKNVLKCINTLIGHYQRPCVEGLCHYFQAFRKCVYLKNLASNSDGC